MELLPADLLPAHLPCTVKLGSSHTCCHWQDDNMTSRSQAAEKSFQEYEEDFM